MGLKMRDWVWDDNRQAGSKAALTRGQNRCLILNLLIWAIFHSVSKNDKNEIEKVLRRSKGWLWSCSARGGKRGAGEDGQIYFPRIYSSYLFLILPHIYYSYFSSYFLIFSPPISWHFLIFPHVGSGRGWSDIYFLIYVHLPILTGIIILIILTRNHHGHGSIIHWLVLMNSYVRLDIYFRSHLPILNEIRNCHDHGHWSFDAILHIYVPIPIMIENHSHGSVWWSGAGIIWVIVVVAYI